MNPQLLPLRADFPCPDCGGVLTIDEVRIPTTYAPAFNRRDDEALVVRGTRPAVAALCSGCEFAIEIEGVR